MSPNGSGQPSGIINTMTDERPVLRIGHSPDPDDAFMWWPLTGGEEGLGGGG